MTSAGQEHRFRYLTATPLWGHQQLWCHWECFFLFTYHTKCWGSHRASFLYCDKRQTCHQPHIETGWVPFYNLLQGTFHFALVTVSLMPSHQTLCTADCSWASTFKKFRMKRAGFNALCTDWIYKFPFLIFWSCVYKEPWACSTISYPWEL